jgi:hypothetical protein
VLRQISDETGETIQDVITGAVEELRRRRIFEVSNAAYAAMRECADEWAEELKERALWDNTLSDRRHCE